MRFAFPPLFAVSGGANSEGDLIQVGYMPIAGARSTFVYLEGYFMAGGYIADGARVEFDEDGKVYTARKSSVSNVETEQN